MIVSEDDEAQPVCAENDRHYASAMSGASSAFIPIA
jgi:hypothetical protein